MFLKSNPSRLKFRKITPVSALGLSCLLIAIAVNGWAMNTSVQPSIAQPISRFSWGQPSTRIISLGDMEFTSIHVDGLSLFQVAAPRFSPASSEPNGSLSPIERRVQRVEGNLYNLIKLGFDPQTLVVRPSTLNNLTVIVAFDHQNLAQQVILTVNELDAQLNPSVIDALAEQWSQIIHKALIRAWQERQPEARKRQIATVATLVLGMVLMSCGLVWGQKRLKKCFNRLKKRTKEQATPALESSQSLPETDRFLTAPLAVLSAFRQQANLQQWLTLNLLLQRLDQVGLILLWFSGVAAILYTFPETRLEGRGVIIIPLRIFMIWLVLTLMSSLANLYVNYKLREWVEQAEVVSENPQRRILRAPTLLEVSRGMIGFASWCIGIIWFLTGKGFFPSSLLTGAGLVGAALTFAFRDLFKDWIMGILIILEDQYAVGDMIEFEEWIGVVENMSLRATQLRRNADGRLSTISHSQMTTAHNLSKDWSRVNFSIEVAYDTDPNVAIALMTRVAQDMADDPQWQDDIIDPVNVIGVNRVTHSGIEILLRISVKRLRQWGVERELRRRLKLAFDEQGMQIGVPQQRVLFPDATHWVLTTSPKERFSENQFTDL
jgi:small-conductance mechanosensitive channel